MTDQLRREAAKIRGEQVRALADRPSQRRTAETPGSRPAGCVRARLEVRAASSGNTADFHGLASATDTPYEMYDAFGPYTETVRAGAFTNTLNTPELDVPLVLAHDRMQVIARTTSSKAPLTLAETDQGLEADAPGLSLSMPYVADVMKLIDAELVDEMSFRFSITRGQWSPDWMEYYIEEVDIHRGDVAIVGYGANPYTSATLRTPVDLEQMDVASLRAFESRVNQRLRILGAKPGMRLEDIPA